MSKYCVTRHSQDGTGIHLVEIDLDTDLQKDESMTFPSAGLAGLRFKPQDD